MPANTTLIDRARNFGNTNSHKNLIGYGKNTVDMHGYYRFQHQKNYIGSQATSVYEAKKKAYKIKRDDFVKNLYMEIFGTAKPEKEYEHDFILDTEETDLNSGTEETSNNTTVDNIIISKDTEQQNKLLAPKAKYDKQNSLSGLLKKIYTKKDYEYLLDATKILSGYKQELNKETNELVDKKIESLKKKLLKSKNTKKIKERRTYQEKDILSEDEEKDIKYFIATYKKIKDKKYDKVSLKAELDEFYKNRYLSMQTNIMDKIEFIKRQIDIAKQTKTGRSKKWIHAINTINGELDCVIKNINNKSLTKDNCDFFTRQQKNIISPRYRNISNIYNKKTENKEPSYSLLEAIDVISKLKYRSLKQFGGDEYLWGRNGVAGYHSAPKGTRNTRNHAANMSLLAYQQIR